MIHEFGSHTMRIRCSREAIPRRPGRAPNYGSTPCIAPTGEIVARTANDVYRSRWTAEADGYVGNVR
jgi:hypothetical protein